MTLPVQPVFQLAQQKSTSKKLSFFSQTLILKSLYL